MGGNGVDLKPCVSALARTGRVFWRIRMTTIADLIYEEAKTLPEHQGAEVLDFIDHLRSRSSVKPDSENPSQRMVELEEFFSQYPRIPKDFKFNREEANER